MSEEGIVKEGADNKECPETLDAVHYACMLISDKVTDDLKKKGLEMQFSPDVIAQVAYLINDTLCNTWPSDLLQFSRHGRRSSVNMNDIKLLFRRNESMLSFIESFVDPTVPSRQRPSGKRAQRRQELIAAKGANTSENKDLKANQGSKLAMKITDFLDLPTTSHVPSRDPLPTSLKVAESSNISVSSLSNEVVAAGTSKEFSLVDENPQGSLSKPKRTKRSSVRNLNASMKESKSIQSFEKQALDKEICFDVRKESSAKVNVTTDDESIEIIHEGGFTNFINNKSSLDSMAFAKEKSTSLKDDRGRTKQDELLCSNDFRLLHSHSSRGLESSFGTVVQKQMEAVSNCKNVSSESHANVATSSVFDSFNKCHGIDEEQEMMAFSAESSDKVREGNAVPIKKRRESSFSDGFSAFNFFSDEESNDCAMEHDEKGKDVVAENDDEEGINRRNQSKCEQLAIIRNSVSQRPFEDLFDLDASMFDL